MSSQASSKALHRSHDLAQPWRGHALTVRRVQGTRGRGGFRYEVLLSSLPPQLQARYELTAETPAAPLSIVPAAVKTPPKSSANAFQTPVKPASTLPPASSDELSEERWSWFERQSTGTQTKARKRLEAVQTFHNMADTGLGITKRLATVAEAFGVYPRTVRQWVDLTKGIDPADWLPVLAPRYKGGQFEAPFTPEAWEWIKANWGTTSQPTAASVTNRARRIAPTRGWQIPSDDTVRRRLDELPAWWKTLKRLGPTQLARMYPAQERDYSTLKVHELWESDGHKADVFCRWPDGTVGRPTIMVFRDVRTRMVLSYRVDQSENADQVRLAFRDAAERAKALPEKALLDNGRAYASKVISGGQKNRYRFKVKESDPIGVLTTLGVQVVWATPSHGQAKPIESWFRTLADYVDRHPDFVGAYCGNTPEAKPEDFNPKRAIPIDEYKAALDREIARYHERTHRGHGMNGHSPRQVYETLIAETTVRRPTAAQLRLCLLAVESVKLGREDQSVTVLGNRYWSEALANLKGRGPYTVRYDPEDATVPVAVYDGDRFLVEAELVGKTGFLNQEAAQRHAREKRRFLKAKKAEAKALQGMESANGWQEPAPDDPALPAPRFAQMVPGGPEPVGRKRLALEIDVEDLFAKGLERQRAAGM